MYWFRLVGFCCLEGVHSQTLHRYLNLQMLESIDLGRLESLNTTGSFGTSFQSCPVSFWGLKRPHVAFSGGKMTGGRFQSHLEGLWWVYLSVWKPWMMKSVSSKEQVLQVNCIENGNACCKCSPHKLSQFIMETKDTRNTSWKKVP